MKKMQLDAGEYFLETQACITDCTNGVFSLMESGKSATAAVT